MRSSYLFTSESVSEGHPDKVADQISDSVLDAVLADDPTGRVCTAMDSPYVDCIGHVTNRKIGSRAPSPIDIERVIEQAVETGTFLEIDSQPDRLDLSDVHARAAREAGLKLAIDSDGHEIGALDFVELGIGQARRAWLTKDDVLNTRTWKQIEKLRKRRP